jgi:Carboxypeptidase regulatory-like domain
MSSKSRFPWRAGLLLLAPLLAAACFGPDHAVSSDGEGAAAADSGIHQGVEGHITAPGPKPLENVAVRPRSLDEPAAAIPEMAVLSEPDGHYSWTLSPGAYEIEFAAEGYQPATRRIVVRPGQTTRLDVLLEPVP